MDFENSKDFPNKTRPTVYKSAFPRKKNLFKRRAKFCHVRAWKSIYLLTAEYETDPDFLRFFKIFQSNMSVCLIISVLCKSCEPICEPEITSVLYHLENLQISKQKQFHVQCSMFSSQILQKAEMNIVMHWTFWRKYRSILHLFTYLLSRSSKLIEVYWQKSLGLDFLQYHLSLFFLLDIHSLKSRIVTRKPWERLHQDFVTFFRDEDTVCTPL